MQCTYIGQIYHYITNFLSLWDLLELAVSPDHVLLLHFSPSSSSSVSSPSSIFSFSSPLLLLHLPFYLPNHQLSFILQIKVGSRFTGNHLSADSFLVHNHSQENRINNLYN